MAVSAVAGDYPFDVGGAPCRRLIKRRGPWHEPSEEHLSKSAFTLRAFSLYVLAAGVLFALVPATILASVGLAPLLMCGPASLA